MTRRRLSVLILAVVFASGCATLMADTIEKLLKDGIELFTSGKYAVAIEKFQEVVRRDPRSWNAYLYLARSFVAMRSWGDAIASGRKALELAPSGGEVIPVLAEAFMGAGVDALGRRQFGEAIGHFVEYVKLKPGEAGGYLQLGRAYLGSGAYGDALRALVQGLGRSPEGAVRGDLVRALLDGGRQALQAGDARGAIGLLGEYVRLEPRNVSAYLELGKAYWQSGEMVKAMGAFQRALELNPDEPEALRFLRGGR